MAGIIEMSAGRFSRSLFDGVSRGSGASRGMRPIGSLTAVLALAGKILPLPTEIGQTRRTRWNPL
jgi:hypothetical protein